MEKLILQYLHYESKEKLKVKTTIPTNTYIQRNTNQES